MAKFWKTFDRLLYSVLLRKRRYSTLTLRSDYHIYEIDVMNFTPRSDRLLLLQLYSKQCKLIIEIYASTDKEIEQFYEQVDQVLKSIIPWHATNILVDFNSRIGSKEKSGKQVGEYGLSSRTEEKRDLITSLIFQKEDSTTGNRYVS